VGVAWVHVDPAVAAASSVVVSAVAVAAPGVVAAFEVWVEIAEPILVAAGLDETVVGAHV
jgi:hypothetical protein